jgi:uncharacterized protein YbjT (DUF2867 family)
MGIGPRILVTGATGNIGREVVAQLRAGNFAVRALSRNPSAANLPDGVDVVPGDLTAPDTLDRALDNAERPRERSGNGRPITLSSSRSRRLDLSLA